MNVDIYRLARAADIDDGQVIASDVHGPVRVDEIRRKNGEVTFLGFRIETASMRRVAVTVKSGEDVAVVPDVEGEQAVWSELLQAIHNAAVAWVNAHSGEAETPALQDAPWGTHGRHAAIVRVDGYEFWVAAPEAPAPPVDDEPL